MTAQLLVLKAQKTIDLLTGIAYNTRACCARWVLLMFVMGCPATAEVAGASWVVKARQQKVRVCSCSLSAVGFWHTWVLLLGGGVSWPAAVSAGK